MARLAELYGALEKAVREYREAATALFGCQMRSAQSVPDIERAELEEDAADETLISALAALATHRAAYPQGEVCATCKKYVDYECLRAKEDNSPMKVFPRETGRGTPEFSPGGWLETDATHGCAAWEGREDGKTG